MQYSASKVQKCQNDLGVYVNVVAYVVIDVILWPNTAKINGGVQHGMLVKDKKELYFCRPHVGDRMLSAKFSFWIAPSLYPSMQYFHQYVS